MINPLLHFRDYVVYGLIMLGLIVSPTAIFNSTPLFCTLCTKAGIVRGSLNYPYDQLY